MLTIQSQYSSHTSPSLQNFHPEAYVNRSCPICNQKSDRFDTFCNQCGEYLQVIFDDGGFRNALKLYLTDLAKSLLMINRNQTFQTLFEECPEIASYLADKTLANFVLWLSQKCSRLEEELDQVARTDDSLRESTLNVQNYLKEITTMLQTLKDDTTTTPQNPIVRLRDGYAIRFGEYQMKWRVAEDVSTVPDENPEVKRVTKDLDGLLSEIDKVYRTLEHQQTLYQKQAQYQLSVANLPVDLFHPTAARILDEYMICGKVLQVILNIKFVDG